MKTATYAPKFTVTFRDFATRAVKIVATDDVVAVSTTKAYQRCTGSWSLSLTYRIINGKRYNEIIQPNDLVEIAMNAGDGSKTFSVMAGLVTRVARSFHAGSNGHFHRTVRIDGEDLGKLLTSEIGWDIAPSNTVKYGTGEMRTYQDRKTLLVGTPAFMTEQVMNRVVAKGFGRLNDYITADRITTDDSWKLMNDAGYMVEQTAIWNALMRFENRPYNALWCDTADDGTFHVGLERYPLDTNGYVSRPAEQTLVVEEWQIVNEDLGTCDSERINFISINSPLFHHVNGEFGVNLSLISGNLVQFDEASINQHGYRPQIIDTEFVPPNQREPGQDNPDAPTECRNRRDLFWNWYSINHELEAGSITIHGAPHVRAGWKLDHKPSGKGFLIEQVSHDFTVWPSVSFTTTLEITRGR